MFHHCLLQNGREKSLGSRSLYPEAQFPGWHGPVLRKSCACCWSAGDTRQGRSGLQTAATALMCWGRWRPPRRFSGSWEVCLSLSTMGTESGVLSHGEGLPTHQGQPWVGEKLNANSARVLSAPVAARRLGGRYCDQGLGLPECGFLLSGLDGLVLAKV